MHAEVWVKKANVYHITGRELKQAKTGLPTNWRYLIENQSGMVYTIFEFRLFDSIDVMGI